MLSGTCSTRLAPNVGISSRKRRDGAIPMLKSVHSTIRNLLKQISRQMPYTNLRGHPRTQGCCGSPINGVLTGAARPINTTSPSPPGFVWIGSINQLLHNHIVGWIDGHACVGPERQPYREDSARICLPHRNFVVKAGEFIIVLRLASNHLSLAKLDFTAG